MGSGWFRRKFLFLLLPLLLLGGCFFPTDFDLRVVIQPNGDFEERFSGLLVEWAPYERMKEGEMTAAEAAAKSRETLQAIAKEPGLKAVKEEGPFRYRMEYQRKGNVFEEFKKAKGSSPGEDGPDVMSFLADLFFLRRQAGGALLLDRKRTSPDDLERFRRLGLEMRGALALRVQGGVAEHNAQAVSGQEYRWTIQSLTEPPVRMLFRLD
ncbi:MAG: hypothetical protein HYT99_02975 [Candidatus Tectomicrobia bacterium]|nr:hypothetical protein [Candidatus Tectomicrobia bacterium]